MTTPRCPGQDQRYWKPEDIFEVRCPQCGHEIEFWKDEPMRVCRGCSRSVRNPRINLGCGRWCRHGAQCLRQAEDPLTVVSLAEKIEAVLEKILEDQPARMARARRVLAQVNALLGKIPADGLMAKATALFTGALVCDDGSLPGGHDSLCNPFRDFPSLAAVLEAAGMDGDAAGRIGELTGSIMAGRPSPEPEYGLVRQALERSGARLHLPQ